MRAVAAWTGAVMCAAAFSTMAAAASSGSAGVRVCYLRLEVGHLYERPTGQFHLALVFFNRGPTTCRLEGWPDALLSGPYDPVLGPTYVLARQPAKRPDFSLPAGSRAHSVLTWRRPSGGHAWVPLYLGMTIPSAGNRGIPLAMHWPYGAVLREDGAPHPGTYIGPLRRGSG